MDNKSNENVSHQPKEGNGSAEETTIPTHQFEECSGSVENKTVPALHPRIQVLQQRLDVLEKQVTCLPNIFIYGIRNLKKDTGRNWEDRLSYLMFNAHVPLGWILETVPENENDNDPDYVQVSFISNHVKRRVVNILNNFLATEYDNIVYIFNM